MALKRELINELVASILSTPPSPRRGGRKAAHTAYTLGFRGRFPQLVKRVVGYGVRKPAAAHPPQA